MTTVKLFLCWMLLLCQFVWAQDDAIVLKEVSVSDSQLLKFSDSQKVRTLSDSVIHKNQPSLTALLNYNTTLYFKENGLGMVSSPSFRGTTAQQTAVIWNGININSQLNGQTDFNTITAQDYDDIAVRSGGGSAIYGSSAIGGSIHLNNNLLFREQFTNQLHLGYGSFNTLAAHYKMAVSNRTVSANVGISRNSSDNDYEYLNTKNKYNQNGQFYNTSMHVAFGYKLNHKNYLKLYSQVFEGERHFSGTLAAPSKSKYQDLNTRNLIEWDGFYNRFTSKLKVAFLNERYKYFEDAKASGFDGAQAETAIARYDLNVDMGQGMAINAIVDYNRTKGFGTAVPLQIRESGSAALLFRHQIVETLGYEISVRQELTDAYASPLLYSVGTHWRPFKPYTVKMNVSKNFRIPTFNDLYWQGSGNPDLKAESSLQAELGQEVKIGGFTLGATGYYMEIVDLIQWTPTQGNWSPENVGAVISYGGEAQLRFHKKTGGHEWDFNANYGYTVSENQKNDRQLIYVPFHKSASNFAYAYKSFGFHYQHFYNGSVYTLSDNSEKLKAYQVSNAGINYQFGKNSSYDIGFRVLNIWNENYQSVSKRPLPGRNYTINLTLKF